ncbi:MAG TPA: hypothetical protein VM286_10555 [Candidatus Thermoplasmatota archaeon]|nr:hypothetical protein [Candidatus Thermoplasmatota archaeon]
MEDRGTLLWEYRPPRAHPILYAGLLVFGLVFVTGALENLARDGRPFLYAVYAAPVVAVLALMLALRPSTTRIHDAGIAPSRVLLLRWWRPFLRWQQLDAVYPASYDVTGAFVSPFASSDGKVTQTGLALEARDGHRETVRFTPSRFAHNTPRSRGYKEAIDVVRAVFAQRGRPLVATAEPVSPHQRDALLAEARKPFLPFFAIVFLFAGAAPLLWVLLKLGVPVAVALPVALLLPLGTSARSWMQSRRRNAILDRLSKALEHGRSAPNHLVVSTSIEATA